MGWSPSVTFSVYEYPAEITNNFEICQGKTGKYLHGLQLGGGGVSWAIGH